MFFHLPNRQVFHGPAWTEPRPRVVSAENDVALSNYLGALIDAAAVNVLAFSAATAIYEKYSATWHMTVVLQERIDPNGGAE
jgi:hypothetical protein